MKYNVELHKISFIEMEAEDFQKLVKKVEKQYPDHAFYGCERLDKVKK